MADTSDLEDEIRAQVDEWSSDSNECLTVTLLRNGGSEHASFQPTFTYPIFGEEQVIFGYQDLSISLNFSAHDMRPHLDIEYGKAFKAIGEIKPTDIKEAMRDFLPKEAFEKAEPEGNDAAAFRPPGERISQYARDGEQFEIWCASLADPAAKRILENMQILVPMLIEGGSMLELEQDWTTQRWKLFLLYQVDPDAPQGDSPYALVGYGTSYRVFTLPSRTQPDPADLDLLTSPATSRQELLQDPADDLSTALNSSKLASPLDLPSRERLSQFLILPPFQGAAHGQALYNAMYAYLVAPPNIREFTIEDPNEAFDDLRDLCDLLHLRATYPAFANLRINTEIPADKLSPTSYIPVELIVPGSTREEILHKSKMDRRQFDRMVEIQTLSHIPPLHRSKNRITKKERSSNALDKAYFFWRLYTKQRLYVHNRDQLMQLDLAERPERVDGAVDWVMEGYVAMLEKVEAREAQRADVHDGEVEGGAAKRIPRKRKVVDEDDEDNDEEDGNGEDEVLEAGAAGNHKKARAG